MTFAASCTWRGSWALVITPKFEAPKIRLGRLKLEWLRALNVSARNCTVIFSRRLHSFCRDTSNASRPGPRTMFRPAVPNVFWPGRTKAAVLNHSDAVLGPMLGSPTRLGRSMLLPLTRPMCATSAPAADDKLTVKGAPL